MTSLDLGVTKTPNGEMTASFRSGWLKHFRVVLSSAGGAALVFGFFSLLQREPEAGFGLLRQWGPWPIVVLVALAFLGRFMSRLNDTIQASFGAVVSSVQQGAEAHLRTADALGRLADQGGRQMQEVQRLAIYAAQEFPGVYERFDRQDAVLERQGRGIEEFAQVLKEHLSRGTNGD